MSEEKTFKKLKKKLNIQGDGLDNLYKPLKDFKGFQKVWENYLDGADLVKDTHWQFSLLEEDYTQNLVNKKSIARLKKLIKHDKKIWIFGDYDSDGFNSAMVLYKLFMAIGYKNFEFVFPTREKVAYRFSDKPFESDFVGFGIKDEILSVVKKGEGVITIDNGGAQVETILKLKNKGVKPIVIDHHNLCYDTSKDQKGTTIIKIPERDHYARALRSKRKAVVVDDDAIYNHPLLNAPYSEYSGSLMTYFFAQNFIKDTDLISDKTSFLQNILIHGIVGHIGDIQSLIPIKSNRSRRLYFKAKSLIEKQINKISEAAGEKQYKIFNGYYEDKMGKQYNRVIDQVFRPYQKKNGKILYGSGNKEILYLMNLKSLNSFTISNVGRIIVPLINHFGRVGYMGELFEKLRNFSQPNKHKPFTDKQTKEIIKSMDLRKKAVKKAKESSINYIEQFTNLNKNNFYKKENNVKVIPILEKNRNTIKDYFTKNVDKLGFLPSFMGLAAGKIQREYNINAIVVSAVEKSGEITFKGSGRGVGNVDLNGILQYLAKDKSLQRSGIQINGGGHKEAVGCEIKIKHKNKQDLYKKFNIINKKITDYLNNKDTKELIKPLLKETDLVYEGQYLETFLNRISSSYTNKFQEMGTKKFEFPKFKVRLNKILKLCKSLPQVNGVWYCYKLNKKSDLKISKFNKKERKNILRKGKSYDGNPLLTIDVDDNNDFVIEWK